MRYRLLLVLPAVLAVAACGGGSSSGGAKAPNPNAPEASPPGDIPDNQVFVPYSKPGSGVSVKVPEGWSQCTSNGTVTFTDNLNSITIAVRPSANGGAAQHRSYLAQSKPDPVTGKTRTNAVEQWHFFHHGKELVLTLQGPKGADNVDPWKIVTDSVRW